MFLLNFTCYETSFIKLYSLTTKCIIYTKNNTLIDKCISNTQDTTLTRRLTIVIKGTVFSNYLNRQLI